MHNYTVPFLRLYLLNCHMNTMRGPDWDRVSAPPPLEKPQVIWVSIENNQLDPLPSPGKSWTRPGKCWNPSGTEGKPRDACQSLILGTYFFYPTLTLMILIILVNSALFFPFIGIQNGKGLLSNHLYSTTIIDLK